MDQTVTASSGGTATKEELLLQISKLEEENKTLCRIVETANQNLGHLKSAIESYSGGFALYDAQDKLILCNETYRKSQPELADVFKPGISFEDTARARIKRMGWMAPAHGIKVPIWELLITIPSQRSHPDEYYHCRP